MSKSKCSAIVDHSNNGQTSVKTQARTALLSVVSVAFVYGCTPVGQIPDPSFVASPVGTVAVSTAALQENHYLDKYRSHGTLLCAGPPPDATFEQVDEADVTISLVNFGGGADDGRGVIEEPLGGRAPSVLITRELMYRLCETAFNYNLGKAEYLALYRETLAVIQGIGEASTVDGSSPASDDRQLLLVPTVSTDDD